MRELEKSIRLSVDSAWSQGARNDYATLPSVLRLAETAAQHPMILKAIGPDIALRCKSIGYGENTLGDLRARVMMCPVREAAKEAVEALKLIAVDLASEIKDSKFGKPPDKIPGLFTSGITEAIVLKLLIHYGRQDADITEDAFFYKDDEKMSPRNMDFVWARCQAKDGAIYECKNQPARLVEALKDRQIPSHDVEWRKSELWLMLRVRSLLVGCHWTFGLNVVTLRPRGPVQANIRSKSLTVPVELAIVCLEDLSRPL
jgi:hypothetical protein